MEFLAKKLSVRQELQAAQKEMRARGMNSGFLGGGLSGLIFFSLPVKMLPVNGTMLPVACRVAGQGRAILSFCREDAENPSTE